MKGGFFYLTKTSYMAFDLDGKRKKITDHVLVESESDTYSEAEKVIIKYNEKLKELYSIEEISKYGLTGYFKRTGKLYFLFKAEISVFNERKHKDIKILNYFLVQDDTLQSAKNYFTKNMSEYNFKIKGITETKIIDVILSK